MNIEKAFNALTESTNNIYERRRYNWSFQYGLFPINKDKTAKRFGINDLLHRHNTEYKKRERML